MDCTAGGGGHSYEIAKRLPNGSRLICLDRDDEAIEACTKRLDEYKDRFTIVKSNFMNLGAALDSLGIDKIDGVMWDLGVSSHQLDDGERGFSYSKEAPLDMRMDREQSITAYDVVNSYTADEIARVLRDYGEEKFASKIARDIVAARETKPIETTIELAELVTESIPAAVRKKEKQNPARRTFQAIRIEVNGELDAIEPSITTAVERLNPGGRLAVITFHSLEDRIVKNAYKINATGCICPPKTPICICGHKQVITLVNKKPIMASDREIQDNSRSKSAKLRIAQKI